MRITTVLLYLSKLSKAKLTPHTHTLVMPEGDRRGRRRGGGRRYRRPDHTPSSVTVSGSITVKGLGTFKTHQGGTFRHWSSHHTSVAFQVSVTETEDGQITWSAREKYRFKQQPRGGGRYVRPEIRDAEMERMEEKAWKKLWAARRQMANGSQDHQVDDFAPVDAEEAQAANKLHESTLCERCLTSGYPCTGIIEILEGVFVRVRNPQVLRNRNARLQDIPNEKVLYHQTSPEAAAAILASGKMRCGVNGSLGGGIYFAKTVAETHAKTRHPGPILECRVRLGNVLELDHPDPGITFSELANDRFDSVKGTFFPTGDEYVVYNSDQVMSIRMVDEEGEDEEREDE
jgi:hypothetical protein